MRRHALGLVTVLLLVSAVLAPVAAARERGVDLWLDNSDERYRRGDDYGFQIEDEEEMMRDRYGREVPMAQPPRLHRCAMNGLESAQYSVAELLLARGDQKAAVALLEEMAGKTEDDLLRNLTRFNIGDIFRRQRDVDAAARHYRQVAGELRHTAARRLFTMLVQAGRPDEAARLTDDLAAQAKEKGEKLALLHQLALAFRRHGMPDRALVAYQRIAKEFTPDDMKQMSGAAQREATAALDKIRRAGDGAPRNLRETLIERRLRELQAARRWDEAKAFEKAVERDERDPEEHERAPMEAAPGEANKGEF